MEQNHEQEKVTFFRTRELMFTDKFEWVQQNVKMAVISHVGDIPGMAFVEDECLTLVKMSYPEVIIGTASLTSVKSALSEDKFNNGGTLDAIYERAKEYECGTA